MGDKLNYEMDGASCMCWARKGAHRVLVWKPEGKDYLEVLDLDCRIILKWIL